MLLNNRAAQTPPPFSRETGTGIGDRAEGARELEVVAALCSLELAAHRISGIVGDLSERLAPIMRPTVEPNPDTDREARRTPLAVSISQIEGQILQSENVLRDICRRLEI